MTPITGIVGGGVPGGTGGAYSDRVFQIVGAPIAYLPMWEASGTTAEDISGNTGRDGTYNNVKLGQTGIGDGRTCPLFDGTTSFTNVISVPFIGAFDGNEGTIHIWAKMFGEDVWTDGIERRFVAFEGAGDFILFRKFTANNTLRLTYNDSIGAKQRDIVTSTLDWFSVTMTWSKAENQTIYYFNGAQQGAIDACDGWGVPLSVRAIIGAGSGVPVNVWSGLLSHAIVLDYAAAPGQIVALTVVP